MVGRRNWKRRWFVLEEGLLEYHKSKSSARPGAAPRGQLNVYGATVHTCCVVPLVFPPGALLTTALPSPPSLPHATAGRAPALRGSACCVCAAAPKPRRLRRWLR